MRCYLTGLETETVVMKFLNVVRVIVFRSIVGQVAARSHQSSEYGYSNRQQTRGSHHDSLSCANP